jgi:hypothetical protein
VELTLLRTATQRRSGVVLTVAGTPGEEAAIDLAARHLLVRVGAPAWTGAEGDVEWAITPRGHATLEEHRSLVREPWRAARRGASQRDRVDRDRSRP